MATCIVIITGEQEYRTLPLKHINATGFQRNSSERNRRHLDTHSNKNKQSQCVWALQILIQQAKGIKGKIRINKGSAIKVEYQFQKEQKEAFRFSQQVEFNNIEEALSMAAGQ
ncbi:PAF1 complex component [Corchorus capsularis]|uniref:PAF1 complex component n=1 Tax=Corchorus capsularis TaxID=210143 RepID=A0A1R3GN19_COCAP|nr:PAF1 complex component [Corchorus capsularis]